MKHYLCAALIAAAAAMPAAAHADIAAHQIAVIANADSRESISVAEHYADARGIPQKHIIKLPLSTEETISRREYEAAMVKPLRKALSERGLADQVRVIVTTYHVPLRVTNPEAQGEEKQFALDAIAKQRLARAALHHAIQAAETIGTSSAFEPKGEPPPEESNAVLLRRAERAFSEAVERLNQLEDTENKNKGMQQLSALIQKTSGFSGLSRTLRPSRGGRSDKAQAMLDSLNKQVKVAAGMIRQLDSFPEARNRGRAYVLTERAYGISGVLLRAAREVEQFKYDSADASVDSELSILWWVGDMYRLQGRLANPLHYGTPAESLSESAIPVLMVSRLDGPSAETARRMVDSALKAEQQGLQGRVYIDARGKKLDNSDSFSLYDQDLRDLGWLIREETDYKVYIDNHEPLIKKAENAAIYSGWYSHRKFAGDFSFAPGAIGYHIASSEAISVRDPEEAGWCKNLLERGIAATMGPVNEPFLESFPMPQEFFGLLMTGKYSLVEAYYLSNKFLSWRMVLFGDPMYKPWRNKALIEPAQLKAKSAEKADFAQIPAPGERQFPDPLMLRARYAEQRKAIQEKIDDFFARVSAEQKQSKPAG